MTKSRQSLQAEATMNSYQKSDRWVSYNPIASVEELGLEGDSNRSVALCRPRTYVSRVGVAFAAVLGVIGCFWTASVVPFSMWSNSIYSSRNKHHHPHHQRNIQPVLGLQLPGYPPASVQFEYDDLVREINWKHVERDIEDLLTDSKEWWPADYGNYGGLFIRLSWHSCGSYRTSDGRGGCDGGAQRYVLYQDDDREGGQASHRENQTHT